MKKTLLSITALLFLLAYVNAQNSQPYWSLAGNSNASSSSKLGTTNDISLRFYTNNTQRMIINSSTGLVGIGVSSPTERLHINSASGSNAFRAQVNGNTKLLVHSNGGVAIGANSTPPENGLYVLGSVGIGTPTSSTTTVGAKLNVVNSTTAGPSIYAKGTHGIFAEATTGFGVYAFSNSIGVSGFGGTSSDSYGKGISGSGFYGVYAQSSTSGGDGVHSEVKGTSNYGVNSYSESSYAIYARTGNSSSYAGFFAGSIYSTGSYLGSDEKLKKNITKVDNATDIISRLEPKNYEYRDDGNFAKMNLPTGKHYGFIAQDIEKVLPNLVKQTQFNTAKSESVEAASHIAPQLNADKINTKPELPQPTKDIKGEIIDFKAVNYIELIPIMVKAIQEQNIKIQEQQTHLQQSMTEKDKEIADLKTKINNLNALIKNEKSLLNSSFSGFLKQNTPNPSNSNTVISYYTPNETRKAQLIITDMKGSVLKAYDLSKGEGRVNIKSGELPTGAYNYTLYVNSNRIDTKQMIILK